MTAARAHWSCNLSFTRFAPTFLLAMALVGCIKTHMSVGDYPRNLAIRDSAIVLVSSREVIVIFPAESDTTWGWPESDAYYGARYHWSISIPQTAGPTSLMAYVLHQDSTARQFASLRNMLKTAHADVCKPGMFASCEGAPAAVRVQSDRVIITLSDPAVIRRLFGLLPDSVDMLRMRFLGNSLVENRFSVPVRYISPQLPAPDSAFRAANAREVNDFNSHKHHAQRELRSDAGMNQGVVWMSTGDNARLSVSGRVCIFDGCYGEQLTAIWTSSDTSILSVILPTIDSLNFPRTRGTGRRPDVRIVAKRIGRAIITASELDSSRSELPGAQVRTLSIAVNVTAPVASLRISPQRDTVTSGESLSLTVAALDSAGRVIPRLPIALVWTHGDEYGWRYDAFDSISVPLNGPTRDQVITATWFGNSAVDTVHVRGTMPTPQLVRRFADTSINALLRIDRETGIGTELFTAILRQNGQRQSRARLDSLADSLIARAVSTRDTVGPASQRATSAFMTLRLSGLPRREGRPYHNGTQVLIRLHGAASDERIRLETLSVMCCQTDWKAAFNYLKQIATKTSGKSAHAAVVGLINIVRMKQRGSDKALRELWQSGAFTDSTASHTLDLFAFRQGWLAR